METMTTTESAPATTEAPSTTVKTRFPAARLTAARDALAALHTKMARAAARSGQATPEVPELTIATAYTELVCCTCKVSPFFGKGTRNGDCPQRGCDGALTTRELLDVEVTLGRPSLAGWEFLAVVEPLTGGNLIRKMPGADTDGFSFEPWRTGAVSCDHCATRRQRKETFLVRADGSDPAIPAGAVRQVGRQCLADFLGGASPSSIVGRLAYIEAVTAAGEGDEGGFGGGRTDDSVDPIEFLVWVAAVIRVSGWISKAVAEASGGEKESTSSMASYLMAPPWGGNPSTLAHWRQARAKYTPTDADTTIATDARTWAIALTGASDYERNLSLVAAQERAGRKHLGILASAVSAYERFRGNAVRKTTVATASTSVHLGAVGERLELTVTVERIADIDTQYGALHIHTLRDAAGNAVVWRTGTKRLEVGSTLALKGTVKAHGEWKGENQTEMTRCKVL